jgi:transporter family-2 protein
MTNFYVLLIVLAGCGVAAQIAVNAGLASAAGAALWAANINFVVSIIMGALALGLAILLGYQPAPDPAIWTAPRWIWLGGVFGSTYVLLAAILARRVGIAVLSAATIVGQLTFSVFIDHYGWFGATVQRVTAARMVGVVFLIAGVVLIRWK